MHELSVALRIVEALDQELGDTKQSQDMAVSTVAIQVGALTGLVPEALEFSWDFATENSLLHGSKLDIQIIDAAGFCSQCQVERIISNLQSRRCPVCKSPIVQITGGNELEILSVEIRSEDYG